MYVSIFHLFYISTVWTLKSVISIGSLLWEIVSYVISCKVSDTKDINIVSQIFTNVRKDKTSQYKRYNRRKQGRYIFEFSSNK